VGLLAAQPEQDALAVAGSAYDAGALEHLQMPGGARLREADLDCEVARAAFGNQQVQDQPEARGVSKTGHQVTRATRRGVHCTDMHTIIQN
jgi:hypothetical protein